MSHSTSKEEAAEIAAAQRSVEKTRADLASAHEAAQNAHATPLSALAEQEDESWMLFALAQRREREASDAQKAGDLRRERNRRWRSLLGFHVERGDVGVHDATLDYLAASGEHDEGEDLHPSRLDPAEAKLDDALTRDK